MSFYRIHSANRDHAAICDPAHWESAGMGDGYWKLDPETGEMVEDIRHGVSACESIDELAAYLATAGIPADDPVLVEFEADYADDDDHDAAQGAVLTLPIRIIRIITDTDPEWAEFDAELDRHLRF